MSSKRPRTSNHFRGVGASGNSAHWGSDGQLHLLCLCPSPSVAGDQGRPGAKRAGSALCPGASSGGRGDTGSLESCFLRCTAPLTPPPPPRAHGSALSRTQVLPTPLLSQVAALLLVASFLKGDQLTFYSSWWVFAFRKSISLGTKFMKKRN